MNSMDSGLEIRVHLINGDVSRFVQDDPEAAAALLSGIDPNRLFEQRELIIQDHGATTVFPWSRSRCRMRTSRSVSRACSPIDGSSRT